MTSPHVLAADIGGGHISSAIVRLDTGSILPGTLSASALDSKAAREDILDAWADCLNDSIRGAAQCRLAGLAFAMPGPFDYRTGTARFEASDKYEKLRGVNVPQQLTPRLRTPLAMRFINDATAFGVGEARDIIRREPAVARVIAVTLGTGFGSAFLRDGIPVTRGASVPPHGSLWHLPFAKSILDDYVSVRWIRSQFAAVRDEPVAGVREIAAVAREDDACAAIFTRYGETLGVALAEWISKFSADHLVIGGSIARAFDLLGDAMQTTLVDRGAAVSVSVADDTDDAAIRGAARLFEDAFWQKVSPELPSV